MTTLSVHSTVALWLWRGLKETGLAANRSGDSWGVAPSLCSAQIALRFVERQVRIGHPAHHTKQKAQRLLGGRVWLKARCGPGVV